MAGGVVVWRGWWRGKVERGMKKDVGGGSVGCWWREIGRPSSG